MSIAKLLVFICAFAVDGVWILYLNANAKKQPLRCATWAALLILLSGVSIVNYVHSPWLLLVAAAGAFSGTFVFMRIHK